MLLLFLGHWIAGTALAIWRNGMGKAYIATLSCVELIVQMPSCFVNYFACGYVITSLFTKFTTGHDEVVARVWQDCL
jgi:hypothetical protein